MWRGFYLPLLLTLLLHGIGVLLLVFGLPSSSETLLARPLPKFVNAELVVMEKPKPKPEQKPKPKPKPKPEPKPAPEPEPKPEPKPKPKPKPDPKPDPDKARKKEEEARKKAEQERREQQRQQQQEELMQALSEDEELLEAQEDAQVAARYTALIQSAIANAWSRPPSARNDMEVELQLRLIPANGEVVDVKVVRSSGDPAFDRSAVRAVKRVGNFQELNKVEYSVFKKYFETFNLVFRPEDLRR